MAEKKPPRSSSAWSERNRLVLAFVAGRMLLGDELIDPAGLQLTQALPRANGWGWSGFVVAYLNQRVTDAGLGF